MLTEQFAAGQSFEMMLPAYRQRRPKLPKLVVMEIYRKSEYDKIAANRWLAASGIANKVGVVRRQLCRQLFSLVKQ